MKIIGRRARKPPLGRLNKTKIYAFFEKTMLMININIKTLTGPRENILSTKMKASNKTQLTDEKK